MGRPRRLQKWLGALRHARSLPGARDRGRRAAIEFYLYMALGGLLFVIYTYMTEVRQ